MRQLFYSAGVRRATRDAQRAFEPIRVTIVLHHADSCSLKEFRVSPKHEFTHYYFALFNKNLIVYILKTKLIRTFMNGNKSSSRCLYQFNDRFWTWSLAIRTLNGVHPLTQRNQLKLKVLFISLDSYNIGCKQRYYKE